MKLPRVFRRKRRKYPVKFDGRGKSARSRSFEMFSDKIPLSEISEDVGVKIETVRRYHQQWKKNPDFEVQYIYFKKLLKKTAPDRERTIELCAMACQIPKEQMETILSQPHGLRRLMSGKFYFPGNADADHKRHIALELALLISDYLVKKGGKFEDVYFALNRYMQENAEYREEEDDYIKEENRTMQFVHDLLAADMENEWRGRVKPDRLTEEERNAIMRLGVETEMKKVEIYYWYRIGVLKAEGLTPEQAREKTYQDLVKKGDLKGAKMIREFQDKVHPLKAGDRLPPSEPLQPPSPT